MKVLSIILVSLSSLCLAEPMFEKEIIVYAEPNENVELPGDDPKHGLRGGCEASVCRKAAEQIKRKIDTTFNGHCPTIVYDVYFNFEQLQVKEPTTLNLIPCRGEPAFFLLNKGEDVFVINYTEGGVEGPTSGASSSMLKFKWGTK